MEAKILAIVERNGIRESAHRGWIAVCDSSGAPVAGTHKAFPSVFVRSSLKTVQALPFILSGGIEKYGLTSEELALVMSSHSGEPVHTAAVGRILAKAGLAESQLKCGTHTPYSEKTARQLLREGLEPRLLHCNCSGKHSAMLAVCLMKGWDTEKYVEYSHPLQQEIRKHLSALLDLDAEQLLWGTDGCGVPTYSLPLDRLAFLFARMADPSSLSEEYRLAFEIIRKTFLTHPYLIAGENRIDTLLMEAGKGLFITKIGGEAVLGAALLKEKLGLAIKIEDGANRPVIPAFIGAIEKLGLNTSDFPELKKLETAPVFNNLSEVVGITRPEVPF